LLGVDLGDRRIGVAVSDDTGLLATPLTVLDLRVASLDDVVRLAQEQGVAGIVAGLPLNAEGDEGYQARAVRAQCARIEKATALPIVLWDERLTTAIAEDIVAVRSKPGKGRRPPLDAIAAAIMLQSFLDSHPLPDRRRAPLDSE